MSPSNLFLGQYSLILIKSMPGASPIIPVLGDLALLTPVRLAIVPQCGIAATSHKASGGRSSS
eukprot:7077385-Pyramimonas_sp.AAC.1